MFKGRIRTKEELSVLVFSSDQLSDKLMSPFFSWKVFILFLKLTRRNVCTIIFSLSFCLLSLFNTLCSFNSNGKFIWDHDETSFRNASKPPPPIPKHFSLFFKKRKHIKHLLLFLFFQDLKMALKLPYYRFIWFMILLLNIENKIKEITIVQLS